MTHTPKYTVEKSSILRDGERVFCLVRAKWGDEAPTWAALVAWEEELASLIDAAPDGLKAAKRALPWIGKMIADNAHLNAVAPNDCIGAMHELQAFIDKAEGRTP